MTGSTAVTSTATPFSRSCVASTSNPMPSTLASSSKPYGKISARLHDRKLEELTDWIRDEKYMIPVRQPSKGEIVSTDLSSHADCMPTITDAGSGGTYRVCHDLIWKTESQFVHLYGWTILRLTVSSDGSLFLWPIISSSEDFMSANAAGEESEKGWVRIVSACPSAMKVLPVRQSNYPEPIWPDLNPLEIANMFFRERVIKSLDHPVHKRLLESLDTGLPASG